MKTIICCILLGFNIFNAYSWGQNGHRIVGLIAEKYLTPKAKKNIQKILKGESVAMVSTYADFIKSDSFYKKMDPLHYCTIADDTLYDGPPQEGDAIMAIEKFVKELQTKKFTEGDEAFTLKFLIHIIGDIHQPLHVGRGDDRGGNDIKVKFFSEETNLHSVWDSKIIDAQQLSYKEFTDWILTKNRNTEQIKKWKKDTLMNWVYESMSYRKTIYSIPENKRLGYEYIYQNLEIVLLRLHQAGVRLAGVLNKIYK
ncbi:MAG: S1/P1 nuclease [Chitinophagaceae bacterium]|nr:S1/P1 nuclease [Chitinophagaceae bacterium]